MFIATDSPPLAALTAAPTPGAPSGPAVEVHRLAKTFRVGFWMTRRVEALCGVDLVVRRGEIFGFLGPNGAGKTTTIKILTGLIAPTAGSAALFGHAPGSVEAQRSMGFLPENPVFYDHLTGRELLDYYSRLLRLDGPERRRRIGELLEAVGLTDAAALALRRYSKGMVQRLGIAQALLQDPELVVLDEPTSGLDPVGRHDVRELMLDLKARGKTVFFSTHIIPDVESVCDRVGFLVRGRLIRLGTVPELLAERVGAIEVVARGLSEPARQTLAAEFGPVRDAAGAASLTVSDEGTAERVVRRVWELGGKLLSVQPQRYSLEELFLRELEPSPAAGGAAASVARATGTAAGRASP